MVYWYDSYLSLSKSVMLPSLPIRGQYISQAVAIYEPIHLTLVSKSKVWMRITQIAYLLLVQQQVIALPLLTTSILP